MRFDKAQVEAMLAKSDAQLWAEIRAMARGRGFNLPEATPNKADMDRIRAALGNIDRISPTLALRMLNEYKRREKNG